MLAILGSPKPLVGIRARQMIRATGGRKPMLSSRRLQAPGLVAAMTLVVQVAWAGEAARAESEAKQFQTERGRTGKERLGGKASDEQRVDNCKVPLDLRGPKPRPDDCGDGVSTSPKR